MASKVSMFIAVSGLDDMGFIVRASGARLNRQVFVGV